MRGIITEKEFIEVSFPDGRSIKGHVKPGTRCEINLDSIFTESDRIFITFQHNIFKNSVTDIIGNEFIEDVKAPIKVPINKRKIELTGVNPKNLKEVEFLLDLNNEIKKYDTVFILNAKAFLKGGFIFDVKANAEQNFFANNYCERNMFKRLVEEISIAEGLKVFRIDRNVKYNNGKDMLGMVEYSYEKQKYENFTWKSFENFMQMLS